MFFVSINICNLLSCFEEVVDESVGVGEYVMGENSVDFGCYCSCFCISANAWTGLAWLAEELSYESIEVFDDDLKF